MPLIIAQDMAWFIAHPGNGMVHRTPRTWHGSPHTQDMALFIAHRTSRPRFALIPGPLSPARPSYLSESSLSLFLSFSLSLPPSLSHPVCPPVSPAHRPTPPLRVALALYPPLGCARPPGGSAWDAPARRGGGRDRGERDRGGPRGMRPPALPRWWGCRVLRLRSPQRDTISAERHASVSPHLREIEVKHASVSPHFSAEIEK